MKNVSILLLSLVILSCGTTKETTLRDANRKGLPFDSVQDTLLKSHFKQNGKLSYEEYKLNDKRLFLRQYFYHKDGSWEVQQTRNFFKNEGFSYGYHPNGQLKMVTQFQNGKENGQYLTYYSDGHRHCICNYKDGKRSGQQTIHWDNGQLFSKEEYQNGLIWNIQERYHKDGQRMDFGIFKDGNGTLKIFNGDGVLENIEHYQAGVKVKTEKNK